MPLYELVECTYHVRVFRVEAESEAKARLSDDVECLVEEFDDGGWREVWEVRADGGLRELVWRKRRYRLRTGS